MNEMKKHLKKAIILLVSCNFLFIMGCVENDVPQNKFSNIAVGDIIEFGEYEQDGNLKNGNEEIEWRVLHVDETNALLISEYGLDNKPFNEEQENTTWEYCTLRKWLNDDFYNEAFTEEEQGQIVTAIHPVDGVPDEYANVTEDKVFLLTVNEAKKYFYNDDDRILIPTQAVKNRVGYWGFYDYERCSWWLRSSSWLRLDFAATVNNTGATLSGGVNVWHSGLVVRPVIWVSIE